MTWNDRGYPSVEKTGPRIHEVFVDTLEEAQGIFFLCPKYFAAMGHIGCHLIEVTFAGRGVSDEMGTHNKAGQPVRWNITGTGFYDLSTVPSILLEGGCDWHGYITNGEVS